MDDKSPDSAATPSTASAQPPRDEVREAAEDGRADSVLARFAARRAEMEKFLLDYPEDVRAEVAAGFYYDGDGNLATHYRRLRAVD